VEEELLMLNGARGLPGKNESPRTPPFNMALGILVLHDEKLSLLLLPIVVF